MARRYKFVPWFVAALALAPGANSYETWHFIDVASVVCPKIEPPAGAPAMPNFSVGINYTSELIVDRPYIFSFLRTTDKAVTVKFRVTDAMNRSVVPDIEVALNVLGSPQAVSSACQCTGATIGAQSTEMYGANYGSSCSAWDNAKCGELWGASMVGGWCCKPWCYATQDCMDAYESEANPGNFFSYAVCTDTPKVSPCTWETTAAPVDPCKCKDVGSLISADANMSAKFNSSYGSRCATWDVDDCHVKYPGSTDTWCCESWCYVEKTCSSAIPSSNPGMEDTLFWSGKQCDDDPSLVSQCPYKPVASDSSTNVALCACLNTPIPAADRPSMLPVDYGQTCSPHDAVNCGTWFPLDSPDMWCCMSWCYVAETCPTKVASKIWPGHSYSSLGCEMDQETISSCAWSDACNCLSTNAAAGLNSSLGFPSDFGTSCKAHDAVSCSDFWSSNPTFWNATGANDWCCDSWCYVSNACPIAFKSSLGIEAYYSYDTCDDDNATSKYTATTDSCGAARRLENDLDELEEAKNLRRLSGRRRSSSPRRRSPRRRSPPAPRRRSPTATNDRRRAPSRPAATTPRRRVSPPPRRRRRIPLATGTAASLRRRSTALNGQNSNTAAGTTSSYGYTDKAKLQNNFGGSMPQQTSYGYSGAGAAKAGKKSNVAMYAAGGAVAGAVVGAGAMYAYQNSGGGGYHSYNSQYGWADDDDDDDDDFSIFRRRRTQATQWCIAPQAAGSRAGEFMECYQCQRWYGACSSSDSCYTQGGCSYTLPTDVNRDDLSVTGFYPRDFSPPLKVEILSLTGDSINTEGICPPITASDFALAERFNRSMSFRADLFLTLTEQEPLGIPQVCNRETGFACRAGTRRRSEGMGACWSENQECAPEPDNVCLCKENYCAEGVGQSVVCMRPGTVGGSPRSPIAFLGLFALCVMHWLRI